MPRHVNVYAVIAMATIMVALFAGWTSWSGYRITSTPAQIRVLLDVRVLASESHIFLEEYLSGDTGETPGKITALLDEASALLAVLEGRSSGARADSQTTAGTIGDAGQRALLETARRDLDELVHLTTLRLHHQRSGAAGSEHDQQFDAAFERFLSSTKTLEDRLHDSSSRALHWFVLTQTLMTLLVLATFAWLYRLLRTRDARDAETLASLEQAHADVTTGRARMQQLNDRQNAMLALSRRVQSAIGVEQFSQVLLGELSERCDIVAGMVWLSRGHLGLRQVARRGTSHADTRPLELARGEGMVGQVALTGQVARYDIPPDYLSVDTGSVSFPPAHTLLLPVCYQDRTVAVFELVFLQSPPDDCRDFMQEVLESLAVRYFMFSSRENPEASPLSARQPATMA